MVIRWQSLLLGLAALAGVSVTAEVAQAQLAPNLTYDGRPTLARLKYTPVSHPGACQGADSRAGAGWGHDYPESVYGMMKGLTELTSVQAATDSNLVLTIEDPELMKHPILMLTEPGCWDPTEKEAKALRDYLLKGGFLLADDFTFFDCTPEHCELAIERFERWMEKVMPNARIVPIPATDPLFDGFFKIDPTTVPAAAGSRQPGQVVGVYQDNNPEKRLMVVGNYWTALGHNWRYVGTGLGSGLEKGGVAYKLGINYMIYALSH
jgi:hypothetical protein